MNDQRAPKALICRYLMQHTTMSLATCHYGQPWVTNLFYASDDRCCLYFVSRGATRHCQDIASNPQVSASISGEVADWEQIKGLQLDGLVEVVSKADRASVIETYLAKFPSLQKMRQSPRNTQDRLIYRILLASSFYRISPKWIRLIDNSKGFGHKVELILQPQSVLSKDEDHCSNHWAKEPR